MEYRYFLTYQNQRVEVEEPAGIGDVTSVLKRDFNTYGLAFQFVESDLTAKFCCNGRQFIREAYFTEGVDAEVTFEIEYRETVVDAWQLFTPSPLRADLCTLSVNADYAECSFYKDDIASKLRTRNDVTISLDAEETLNGTTLSPLPETTALFHSKTIQKAANYRYNEAFASTDHDWKQGFADFYLIPAFEYTVNEIVGAQNAPTPKVTGAVSLPQHGNIFYSGILGSATRNITIAGQLVFSIQNTQDTNTFGFELNVYRYQRDAKELEKAGSAGSGSYNSTLTSFSLPIYANINVASDENLILALRLPATTNDVINKKIKFNVDLEQSYLQLTENTVVEDPAGKGSHIPCNKLYDAISRSLEIITDKVGVLKSDFLETGPAAANIITNGFKLRGFADRPVQFKFKEAIESLQAIFNIGYGIEGVGSDQKVVVEEMSYFFRDSEIIRIDDVVDYEEITDEEHLISQINIGYEKYAQDENQTNTIDDVHTRHEYLLPVSNVKNPKDIICKWILSAYLIEVTRRKAFEESPTESFKYDNDIFMIYTLGGDILVAEKDEAFQHVTGILSPETMYNLRYPPKHMLLNWGKYINSFLYYHPREALIKNQKTLLNGNAETQFRTGEPFKLGDEQNFIRIQGAHEKLEDIYSMKRVFRPEIVTFTTTLCKEDIDFIVAAHQGALVGIDESKNYGYINVRNYDGSYTPIFLLEMKWNYLERVVNFRGIKQATEPEPVANIPGLLQETLGYNFITTEGGIVIALE